MAATLKPLLVGTYRACRAESKKDLPSRNVLGEVTGKMFRIWQDFKLIVSKNHVNIAKYERNANQNFNKLSPHTSQNAHSQMILYKQ